MSKEFIGFVAKLSVKHSPPTAKRKWTLYSVKLENKDGTEYDDWLSFGFEDPGIKEGDYIKVQADEKDGRFNANVKTLQISKNAPARARKPAAASGSTDGSTPRAGSNRFDGTGIQNRTNPEDAKRMTYQSSRGQALELVSLLLAHDALPITKANTKAAESKRFDEINAAVDKLTVRFYNDGFSLRLLETVADTVPDKAPDGPLPDREETSNGGSPAEDADDAGSNEFDDDIPF